jgi:hypothetical protein
MRLERFICYIDSIWISYCYISYTLYITRMNKVVASHHFPLLKKVFLVMFVLGVTFISLQYEYTTPTQTLGETIRNPRVFSNKQITLLLMEWGKGRPLWPYDTMRSANAFCSPSCSFTNNVSLWNESSAVFFHANWPHPKR